MLTATRWAGALALVMGVALVPQAAANAEADGPEPVEIARGVVRLGAAPLSGADVIVRLWPDHGTLKRLTEADTVPFHTVGVTKTDSRGRYALAIDPGTIPDLFMDDATGIVDVEVIVASDRSQARWSYSVEPGRDAWRLSSAGAARGVDTRFNLANGLVWERSDDPLAWVGEDGRTARMSAGTTRAEAAGTSLGPITPDVEQLLGRASARGFNCDTRPGEIHYNRPEKFMWVKGTDSAPVRVIQAINNQHTMGVGLTYSPSSGGWSESGSQTETFSASASKGGLQRAFYIWDAVNYRDYHNMCAPTYRRPHSYYDLISRVQRAGTALPLEYCRIKRRGYVAQTGTAKNVTFASGVDIGPISVMANAGYDHGVDQRIVFRARRLLCWNSPGGWPASSRIGAWIPTANYD